MWECVDFIFHNSEIHTIHQHTGYCLFKMKFIFLVLISDQLLLSKYKKHMPVNI